jgi:hypothetical protein
MARQPKTEEEKAVARAARADAREQQEAREEKEERQRLRLLQERLPLVEHIVAQLSGRVRAIDERERQRKELLSHTDGFYDEMDKLAKGKSMLPVTDLMVEQANDIIRDSKALISGDSFLGRVKEFVPAGDNPVFPDVVVHLRTIRLALQRYESTLKEERERAIKVLWEAKTVRAGVTAYLSEQEWPHLSAMKRRMEDPDMVSRRWLDYSEDAGQFFAFDRFASTDLLTHFGVEAAGE